MKMSKKISQQIKKIEAAEKKGQLGVWRKEFCRRYPESLARIQSNTYNALAEAAAQKGEAITCRKGCTYCCFHYVAVSLAHGIVIVDYLYKRQDLLQQFLTNYEHWRHKGYSISAGIDRTRIQAFSSSVPIDRIIEDTRPMSSRYLGMNIQCPFLDGDRCFIYHVRPWSCSGHYAVSPPNLCAPGAKQEPVIHHMIPSDSDLTEIVLLADPRLILYELSLPIMVHRLLTEGSSCIMDEVVHCNFA
jgi:Fe-S-cluster containining protein